MFSVHVNATFDHKSQSDDAYKTAALLLTLPQFRTATYKTAGISEVSDKVGEHPGFVDETWHDDQTMMKARNIIKNVVDSSVLTDEIINELLNSGILFRERVPE